MADEPIDSDESPESIEGAEEEPIESEPVDKPAASESDGLVVEAQVVAPNVRKKIPRWIFAAVFAVLALGGSIYGFDSWARSAEADAFSEANESDTVEAWEEFLAWAEGQGAWTRSRTPLERHVSYATQRKDVRRANRAAETSDWPALCTMLEEFSRSSPGYAAAQRSLRERADGIIQQAMSRLASANIPVTLRQPVEAAFMEAAQNSPCGATARVRFQVNAGVTVARRETILAAATAAIDVALQPIVQELSAGNELFAFELSDSHSGDPVTLEYSVNAEFVSGEAVRISDGTSFEVPALLVEVRVHGPSTEMASRNIRYTLPAAFAVEVFAESRAGKSPEELTTIAVERLVGHVPARLRQVSGLSPFVADGGVAAYSRCAGMEVIDRSAAFRSDTAELGTDRTSFSCEDPEEPYYEGCCADEDPNSVGRPEIGYRLVVNEPSLVSLSADAEHSAIASIFSECGPSSREVTCGELGTTRALLDPGVYTAYVSGAADEEAGEYVLSSSIQPVGAIAAACSAVSDELQPGVAFRGSTARAEDDFAGGCGGAGVPEDMYRLQVPVRSRVRCRVEGFDDPVIHARSDCEDFESELGCSVTDSLRLVAEPGTLFVSVDGAARSSKGAYEIVCDVEPVPSGDGNNTCAAAPTVDLSMGQEAPLLIDLMSAPDSRASLCRGRGGPEAVYRFELSEDAFVQVSPARGATLDLFRECEPGSCTGFNKRRLSAGTHYLIARGRESTDFIRQSVSIRATPLAAVCEAAVLLRAGVTGGVLGGRAEPAMFGAECTTSSSLREAIFRIRALHTMHIRLRAEGVGLSIHEGCGGRSLTCAPGNVGSVEARLEPGEYTVLVRGSPGRSFQLETEIERL